MGADLKMAGSGFRSEISILLCPFCRYAIVHTNHHFARKREYSDGHPSHFLLQLVGKTDACQRILIKNTPDVVRRPACFVVKGVQGSGLAPGAACPLIVDEIFACQLGVRSEELGVLVRRIKIWKHRRV